MSLPPPTNKTVLITGINGYIAAHIGLTLLKRGYTVRGTARTAAAGEALLTNAFKDYAPRYEHHTTPDITQPGAFDAAVPGVHAIIHTASPVDFSLTSVDAFFGPAVAGNRSLLDSAAAHAGPQLASFVLTSSNAAMADRWRLPAEHAYSEADWNESGERVARESERAGKFLPMVAYGASKAAAERAMWRWREERGPRFACAAVNPSVVTGPPVHWPAAGPEGLNETLMPVWRIFSGEATEVPAGIGAMAYVDVRDVAELHVWCMEHPRESDGQRYLMTNGKGTPQAVADLLRRHYPDREIVVGNPGCDYIGDDYWWPDGEARMEAKKAYAAMGVERFIKFDKSILDTVEAFEKQWPDRVKNRKTP